MLSLFYWMGRRAAPAAKSAARPVGARTSEGGVPVASRTFASSEEHCAQGVDRAGHGSFSRRPALVRSDEDGRALRGEQQLLRVPGAVRAVVPQRRAERRG